jgi:hypothetical protein
MEDVPMKKNLMLAAAVAGLVGCGSTTTTDAGVDAGTTLDFSTPVKIVDYLEGKTMVMTGTDIPTSPLGFSENLYLAAATQCYNKVSIQTLAGNFIVTSDLGQLNRPDGGVVGTCDRTVKAATVAFTSSALLIEHVANNGGCFDITATYTGFKQEGRAKISADGKTVTMELYFAALGHRCADGAVGSGGVTVVTSAGSVAFTGNAQQVYRIP